MSRQSERLPAYREVLSGEKYAGRSVHLSGEDPRFYKRGTDQSYAEAIRDKAGKCGSYRTVKRFSERDHYPAIRLNVI